MNGCIELTKKEAEMKANFVKYVAMLIKKYGNLDINKNEEKEVA